MMNAISRRAVMIGLAAVASSARPGTAQEQPLKIIYPYAAGGSGDAIARMVAERLQKDLGRSVIVENKAGAGGRIGTQAAKDANPDGSTLLFAAGALFTLQPHLYENLGYDPFADFAPIGRVVKFDQALAVSSHTPIRSISDLAMWLRSNPDQAMFGSPGIGTIPHLALLEFGRAFGIPLRHVPYRGTPAALPDLLAGRLPIYMASLAELIEHHKSGSIRIIAIGSDARNPVLPDVSTLKEAGIQIAAPGWFAFYAGAATPLAIRDRLEAAVRAAAKSPDVQARINSLGFQATDPEAQDLKRVQRAEFDAWAAIVKSAGLKLE
jgi:tripartite-type tricarboxylate transporter receptor subunit TctC